jgi:hypothetical protein
VIDRFFHCLSLTLQTQNCHHPQKIASSLAKIDAKARTGKAYAEVTEGVLADVRKQIQVFHPAKVWSIITPELYTTFWTLSLYDLEVPRDAYVATTKRAKDAVVRCVLGTCPFFLRQPHSAHGLRHTPRTTGGNAA